MTTVKEADKTGHRQVLSVGADGRGAPVRRNRAQNGECGHNYHGWMLINPDLLTDPIIFVLVVFITILAVVVFI